MVGKGEGKGEAEGKGLRVGRRRRLRLGYKAMPRLQATPHVLLQEAWLFSAARWVWATVIRGIGR